VRRGVARRAGAHPFEIGAVERDDVAEAVEIITLDLACGLPGNVDTVAARDRYRAGIGRRSDVIGGSPGRTDMTGEALFQRRRAERAFGHR